jgi:hypothetical protein
MAKLLSARSLSSGTDDKKALIDSWRLSVGDTRTKMEKPASSVKTDPVRKEEEDDVSKFEKFCADERKSIADLGITAKESWIQDEIYRRWIAKSGGTLSDESSVDVTKITSKVASKAMVSKQELQKKQPTSKEKVEMSDIELPDSIVESLGVVFVGKFRDKFMYKPREESNQVKKVPTAAVKKASPSSAAQSAGSKRKSTELMKPVKGSSKGSFSKKAKPAPEVKPIAVEMDPLYESAAERIYKIVAGRILEKSKASKEGRAWRKQGLKLWNAELPVSKGVKVSDDAESAELARQMTMMSDDAQEDDDEDDDDLLIGSWPLVGSADEEKDEEEDDDDDDDDDDEHEDEDDDEHEDEDDDEHEDEDDDDDE